ncbi:MAG TPA: phytoene/squalene synthase family protein [Phycisphaerae bacterium]|jgi:phytoene synthase|nr:phytoene/squalene synthase family protein [Phycisphaerae bacterium]
MTATSQNAAGVAGPAAGVGAETLAKSRDFCRDVTRREARNFYYGLKLLPEPKRSAMYALYAYMRLVDDIADDDSNGRTPAQRSRDLDQWEELTRQAIAAASDGAALPAGHPLWPAFASMVRDYRVPAKIFEDMIAGQRQDLEPVAIPDFPAMHQYCYRVASVVGVASLYVFGFRGGDDTLKMGVDRGIAFQLTNILRDLGEDAAPPRRRCYIPADELARFRVHPEDLAQRRATPDVVELMKFQIERARGFYEKSAALESRVDEDARPTLSAMTAIYRGILEKIARNPAHALQRRVSLSPWAKMTIAWRAMRRRK